VDPESGQSFLTALGAVQDAWTRDGVEDTKSASQRRADALVELCGAFLDRSDRPQVAGERPHVVVTVDLRSLQGKLGRRSELEDTGPITPETARRLACDAGISRIITTGASEPLDVVEDPCGALGDAEGADPQRRRMPVPRLRQAPGLV
jgi:Domain of unknown function (DUF222)